MAKYLRRLIKIKCDCGNMANYLNIEEDHGVIWYTVNEDGAVSEEQPLLNANDHKEDINIMNFGRCSSENNKIFGGDRDFHWGSLMDAFGTAVGACDGYKCTPYCSKSWKVENDKVWLDGAPIITDTSELTCYYGGKISLYVEDEDSQETEQTNSKQSSVHGGEGKSRQHGGASKSFGQSSTGEHGGAGKSFGQSGTGEHGGAGKSFEQSGTGEHGGAGKSFGQSGTGEYGGAGKSFGQSSTGEHGGAGKSFGQSGTGGHGGAGKSFGQSGTGEHSGAGKSFGQSGIGGHSGGGKSFGQSGGGAGF